jgi:hypothetical protein
MSGGSDVGSRVMDVGKLAGRVTARGDIPAEDLLMMIVLLLFLQKQNLYRWAWTKMAGSSCASSNWCSAHAMLGKVQPPRL